MPPGKPSWNPATVPPDSLARLLRRWPCPCLSSKYSFCSTCPWLCSLWCWDGRESWGTLVRAVTGGSLGIFSPCTIVRVRLQMPAYLRRGWLALGSAVIVELQRHPVAHRFLAWNRLNLLISLLISHTQVRSHTGTLLESLLYSGRANQRGRGRKILLWKWGGWAGGACKEEFTDMLWGWRRRAAISLPSLLWGKKVVEYRSQSFASTVRWREGEEPFFWKLVLQDNSTFPFFFRVLKKKKKRAVLWQRSGQRLLHSCLDSCFAFPRVGDPAWSRGLCSPCPCTSCPGPFLLNFPLNPPGSLPPGDFQDVAVSALNILRRLQKQGIWPKTPAWAVGKGLHPRLWWCCPSGAGGVTRKHLEHQGRGGKAMQETTASPAATSWGGSGCCEREGKQGWEAAGCWGCCLCRYLPGLTPWAAHFSPCLGVWALNIPALLKARVCKWKYSPWGVAAGQQEHFLSPFSIPAAPRANCLEQGAELSPWLQQRRGAAANKEREAAPWSNPVLPPGCLPRSPEGPHCTSALE